MQEREAYIALNMAPGVGAVLVRNGIARLGSAVNILRAGPALLATVEGIGAARAGTLAVELGQADWRLEMSRAEAAGMRIITPADSDYPPALKTIHDPPLALYLRGDAEALRYSAVAVVGTRAPTTYGRETARRFAYLLARAGLTVVSGLARGIDTEAHRATLKAGGRTAAVIGSALDRLYPAENRELAEQIVASGGALLSEYPLGRPPDRQTFPMRNRIVSGLSGGVLVVEAGRTSGTLITAAQALEQGRAVMAVPGRIDSPAAQGCHKLLRQGATLVECLDDVLDELQALPGTRRANPAAAADEPPSAPAPAAPALDDVERRILQVLEGGELSVEALIERTGLPAGVVGARLMGLEMRRLLRRLPGHLVTARGDRGAQWE